MIKKKKYYVNKKDITREIILYKDSGVISNKLHNIFLDMSRRLVNKQNSNDFNFASYTKEYKEDMIQEAYIRCITYGIRAYDVDQQKSPLAYFTSCIVNTFKAFVKKEKTYQDRKWNELGNHMTKLEHEYGIRLEINENIKEKMYKSSASKEYLNQCEEE